MAPAKAADKKAPAKEAEAEHAGDGGPRQEASQERSRIPPRPSAPSTTPPSCSRPARPEQAAQALTAVLAGGNLPPAIMAKALLYRGIAYRQQKKPAQAIADLTSALWLKGGLSESDRADGLRQRTAAYQEAGLSQGGESRPGGCPKRRAARSAAPAGYRGALERRHDDVDAARARRPRLTKSTAQPRPAVGWDLFASLVRWLGTRLRRRQPTPPPRRR